MVAEPAPGSADSDDDSTALRPDLYRLDHGRRAIAPIEFTVLDDDNLTAAVDAKHRKQV